MNAITHTHDVTWLEDASEYQYCAHPDEPRLILVRRDEMRYGFHWYGLFPDSISAQIALNLLRNGQGGEELVRE